MRVMVFSSKVIARRLIASLAEEGIELVRLSELTEAITLVKRERFDLALVDSLGEEAETVCRCIGELGCVPVVLMVDRTRADWARLQSLGIHGYLPRGANGAELAARMRAVARRCVFNGEIEKNGGVYALKRGQNIDKEKGAAV